MAMLVESSLTGVISQIQECETIDKALEIVKQIKALKTALESVKQFEQQSIKYALLQCEALLKVIELGGVDKLRGSTKKTAIWLSTLSEPDRAKYINMCNDGMTITAVWKREVGRSEEAEERHKDLLEDADYYRVSLCAQLNSTGIVDMTEATESIMEKACACGDSRAGQDLIDGLRNSLRASGGIGVGFNSKIYVSKNTEDKQAIISAVVTRIKSINSDIRNLSEILKSSETKLSLWDIDEAIYTHCAPIAYSRYVVQMLFDDGCLANSKDSEIDEYLNLAEFGERGGGYARRRRDRAVLAEASEIVTRWHNSFRWDYAAIEEYNFTPASVRDGHIIPFIPENPMERLKRVVEATERSPI